MTELLALLFQARNIAHVQHWKAKSFSVHLALGELYESLVSFADELAEMYMGRHGTDFEIDLNTTNDFDQNDPVTFIKQLDDKLEEVKVSFATEEFLQNKFQELQGIVSQTKYKLENLRKGLIMTEFKKLDDLPKGKPNSYEEVMKAMAVLHKLVLKQSEAYGGKNSKYIPAHVLEGSLLKSFTSVETELFEGSEVDRLLGIAHDRAESLSDHLKSKDDEKAMRLLGSLLRMLGAAMGANHDEK